MFSRSTFVSFVHPSTGVVLLSLSIFLFHAIVRVYSNDDTISHDCKCEGWVAWNRVDFFTNKFQSDRRKQI